MATRTIDGMKRRPVAKTSVGVEGVKEIKARAARTVPVRIGSAPKAAAAPKSAPARKGTTIPVTSKKVSKQSRDDFLKPVSGFDMDLSEDEIKKDAPKKRHILRKIVIALVVLLLAGGIVAYCWGDQIIRKLTNGQSGLGDLIGTVISDTYADLKTDQNGRTNILILGTSGYDMSGSDHDGAALTDTIMIISADQKTGDFAMVNLPRDFYLGTTCTSTGKINEVYWCNNTEDEDEKAGAEALAAEVEKILGIDLQYYAHVNWGALVQIVDILDGITVTLDESINDTGWTNIIIEAGVPTVLDGEQALGLARARHGTESGDFTRANSQQKILIALKDRLLEKGLSLTDAIGILNTLGDNVRTSFTMEEIKSIYHLATTLDLSTAMRSVSLLDQGDGTSLVSTASFDPSGLGYEVSFIVPAAGRYNYRDIQKYIKKQFSSDPVARENPSVLILNGTGESGVASAEKSKLEQDGFVSIVIDDAPEGYWEGIKVYDVSSKTPSSLALITSKYGIEASSTVPAEIDPTGYDIVIIVGITKEDTQEE